MKRAKSKRLSSAAGMARWVMIGVASLVMLAACIGNRGDDALGQAQGANAYTNQTCAPRIPASTETRRIPNPENPSACFAVMMMCNFCNYDATGLFTSSGMRPCGVCVGWDTP